MATHGRQVNVLHKTVSVFFVVHLLHEEIGGDCQIREPKEHKQQGRQAFCNLRPTKLSTVFQSSCNQDQNTNKRTSSESVHRLCEALCLNDEATAGVCVRQMA